MEKSIHFHVLVSRQNKKINVTNTRLLDVTIGNKVYKGHYKTGQKDVYSAIKYVTKGAECISTNDGFFKELAAGNTNALILEAVSKGVFTNDKALEYINESPGQALGNVKNAIKAFETSEKISKLQRSSPVVPESPHKLEDFEISASLQEWIDAPDYLKPPLLLVGRSGAGKTRFAKALAKSKNWRTVVINVKDGMSAIKAEHKLILFDDYDFQEKNEELLSLFTRESDDRTQHRIIYQVVEISGEQIMIFTMNYSMLSKLKVYLREERFSRRVHIERVADKFLKRSATTVNVYVQGNLNMYNLSELEKERIAKNNATLDMVMDPEDK